MFKSVGGLTQFLSGVKLPDYEDTLYYRDYTKDFVRNGLRSIVMTALFPAVLIRTIDAVSNTNSYTGPTSETSCNVVRARKTTEFAADTILDFWFKRPDYL